MVTENEVRDFISSIVDEEGMQVFEYLKDKEEVSDEKIAENLDIDEKKVRSTLYNFYDHGIANYRRIQDKETKWYTYFWQINNYNKIQTVMAEEIKNRIEELNEALENQEEEYYSCGKPNHPKLTFDGAIDLEFKCPKCGDMLEPRENENLKAMKDELNSLRNKLSRIKEN